MTPGSGVAAAAGKATNASGGFVTYNGALGTPTGGNLGNATGLPVSTGLTGLGSGVASALGNATNASGGVVTSPVGSANLAAGAAAANLGFTPLNAANNLSDVGSAATARTNLGLGSAATQNSSSFLQPGNNLSDVGSAATSRANLGLGALSTGTPGSGVAAAAGDATNASGGFVTYSERSARR